MAILFLSTRFDDETHVGSRASHHRSTWFRGEWVFPLLPVGALLVLWGVIFTVLPVSRLEFPLNDDWAYSRWAFAFARGEGIHFYHQPSMPLLGQWLLAYPIIRIVGESHVALRLLTVALSIIGSLAFYALLRREVELSHAEASFVAASLALNPLFFLMCGSFMSDVPAFSLSLVALALYSSSLREGGPGKLVLAAVAATLATITRQNAVVTPLVAGILLWRHRALRWRPVWHGGVWLPLIAGIAVHWWFTTRPDAWPLPPRIPSVRRVCVLCYAVCIYMGLAVLPLLALRPGFISRGRYFAALVVMLDGVVVCLALGELFFPPITYHGGLFPYLSNMITPWGTLEDGVFVAGKRPLMMGRGVQTLLTVLACIGGAALADRAAARIRGRFLANPLFLFTALHALILLISPALFDRYLIVLMPGSLALTAGDSIRARWPLGLGALALFAACSAGLTHDWFAWNSARWELGRRALARGISADDIEGGMEWDSWHAPGPVVASKSERPHRPTWGLTLPFNHWRHPHITGRYALAFSQLPGTIVLDSEPYRLWLVPGKWRFFLLEERDDDKR